MRLADLRSFFDGFITADPGRRCSTLGTIVSSPEQRHSQIQVNNESTPAIMKERLIFMVLLG